jgi:hypothetical protein
MIIRNAILGPCSRGALYYHTFEEETKSAVVPWQVSLNVFPAGLEILGLNPLSLKR